MPIAIDLFCGAGGLAEGILQSGLDIVFSSDKNEQVRDTYVHRSEQLGYREGIDTHFELRDVQELTGNLILNSINKLQKFRDDGEIIGIGDIDVSFGGPPCQGFSRAGKRSQDDPRNLLFHEYVRIIKEVFPKYVVMENVSGFMDMQMLDFPSVTEHDWTGQHLVKEILRTELEELDYTVLEPRLLNASDYGVPQNRKRAIFLAYRNDQLPIKYPAPTTHELDEKVTVRDAFDGLEVGTIPVSNYGIESFEGRTPNADGEGIAGKAVPVNADLSGHAKSVTQRFSLYHAGESTRNVAERIRREGLDLRVYDALFYETLFQVNKMSNQTIILDVLHQLNIYDERFGKERWLGQTNKLLSQLALHPRDEALMSTLSKRFMINREQLDHIYNPLMARLNQNITSEMLQRNFITGHVTDEMMVALLTRKNSRQRLDPEAQAPTMVTLPDDFIHPSKNRILTVREMARIQSFDDSFELLGKRTTGGVKRKEEVPQYSQVGNAVPPLLGKAVAQVVFNALTAKE
ncbi:DNA cytosine methyltransferase [Liquorilactobacillus hordei]|uniref:DNA cytosine methyltransferase n=1 Tax=Liquorilactobacillus hordei TaxID=468911 RepID=UPI001CC014E0|nr:DNA cytosine methyltransferase [Liquorilactobacillus hordei]MBZ2405775.1 DNA (cytosine-5-)-methyltransferase [Liquorilactobacillus hordei]